jgi:hypothetical protein
MSKWKDYNAEIIKLLPSNNNTQIAEMLLIKPDYKDVDSFRKHVKTVRDISGLQNTVKPAKGNIVEKQKKHLAVLPYLNGNPDNILVIGDPHEPFTLVGYLKFCREQQEIYDCGTVIFIGDIIDNHYSSYHESDPDGFGAGEELDRTVHKIKDWYRTFPVATIIIGNHDRLVYRKAFSAGVSKKWIRDYKDVLEVPNWNFVENIEIHNINFNHGEGGTAKNRMKSELQSQVQGHLHTQLYAEYAVGANFIVFGMQVGCGIDIKSYAMAYGKNYKKPAIGCGVVLNKGTLPIAIPMKM